MTETPPERPVDDVLLPPDPTDERGVGPDQEGVEPDRDADGVAEDRLTGVAFYDTLETRYVGGVHPSKTAARKAEPELAKADRYALRRV